MFKGKVKRHVETVHKKKSFVCKRCNYQPSSELMGIPKFGDFLEEMKHDYICDVELNSAEKLIAYHLITHASSN